MWVTPAGVLGSSCQTTKVFPDSPEESLNSASVGPTPDTPKQPDNPTQPNYSTIKWILSYNIVASAFAPPLLQLQDTLFSVSLTLPIWQETHHHFSESPWPCLTDEDRTASYFLLLGMLQPDIYWKHSSWGRKLGCFCGEEILLWGCISTSSALIFLLDCIANTGSKCISVDQHFWAMGVFYRGYQQDSAFESFVDLDQQFSVLVIHANV